MKTSIFMFLLICLVSSSVLASLRNEISVDFVADDGRVFPAYQANIEQATDTSRAYLQAVNGENYRIRIRNKGNQRIGLVIAVDGRNIISGAQSNLVSSEPMYILGPYEQAGYEGWRTGQDRVHRFFFTDSENSYADAWDDRSAMGVIAIAVFHENSPGIANRLREQEAGKGSAIPGRPAILPKAESARDALSQPGTGFGDERYSVARRVQFEPLPYPADRYFFKYEWRETLCDKGIVDCGRPGNRFWPDYPEQYGFAPYPPG